MCDIHGHVLGRDESSLDRPISRNRRPLLLHVNNVDPRMEMSLPEWNAVVVDEPSIGNPGVLQISLFKCVNGFVSVFRQYTDLNMSA